MKTLKRSSGTNIGVVPDYPFNKRTGGKQRRNYIKRKCHRTVALLNNIRTILVLRWMKDVEPKTNRHYCVNIVPFVRSKRKLVAIDII